ncbi:MAG: hypothetical protein ACI9KE_006138 [Polyangiales bacterium]
MRARLGDTDSLSGTAMGTTKMQPSSSAIGSLATTLGLHSTIAQASVAHVLWAAIGVRSGVVYREISDSFSGFVEASSGM